METKMSTALWEHFLDFLGAFLEFTVVQCKQRSAHLTLRGKDGSTGISTAKEP